MLKYYLLASLLSLFIWLKYVYSVYISGFVERYGEGETYELPCPKCTHPVEVVTTGVHFGSLGSIKIYSLAGGFECPMCFYKQAPRSGINTFLCKYIHVYSFFKKCWKLNTAFQDQRALWASLLELSTFFEIAVYYIFNIILILFNIIFNIILKVYINV